MGDLRLCRPDVRRGSASPFDAHLRLGFALGSGSALLWAKGRTRGIAPLTFKLCGEAEPRLTSGRHSRDRPFGGASPHIGAA
jgi:hypothetical protein